METIDTVDEKYKEGFNIGYWLARGNEKPQKDILTHLIAKQPPETLYAKGLLAGKKQMEKEKTINLLNDLIKSKGKDRER